MPFPGENAWDSLTTVACPSPGNCVMGGTFRDSNGFFQGLIGSLHGRAVTTRTSTTSGPWGNSTVSSAGRDHVPGTGNMFRRWCCHGHRARAWSLRSR